MIIAAKFNISVRVGWPELQIIRGARTVFSTNTMEPKPTGYLNVYEYNLSARNFNICAGDVLNISWHGDIKWPDQIRFSLAYYDSRTSSKGIPLPMVSIIVDDDASDTDRLMSNNPYCEVDTKSSTSGTTSTNRTSPLTEKPNANDSGAKLLTTTYVATICGVVFFSLLLTILIILVVICMVVVRRRRKSTSVNTVDSTGINRYVNEAQPFHDTAGKIILALTFIYAHTMYSPGNVRGPVSENDYITDDGIPGSAQASAVLHDNPQDVRLMYEYSHSSQVLYSCIYMHPYM